MSKTAQEMVDLYIEAEIDVLAGKSTIINGRQFTAENLQEIRAGRQEWERRDIQEKFKAAGKRPGPAYANFC
ncbi:primosomal replication protein PriB/PriC domain protein [Microbulbifer variabilis]|uniref:Primosomal replication protein PriB/PriC domain protein n=1 Tax=Microbulbifer variabilis TaxID=266805 RepID=A0ABY4V6T1_9GAMM|nr:primosomal replication protein PriB/PriC domain protein [Microbulbifer variabilis]USD19976.1 primosomal replication protein PriB/PriC domain protein [Microbulbifer variabilis]